jgi:hypothetical protein
VNDGHLAAAVAKRSAEGVVKLPVRLHGLTLARPVDVFLDRDDFKLVGLDVLCGDDEHRFLPLAAATVGEDAISISSPLVLLEDTELAFYRSRTISLGSLRGRPVRRRDTDVGLLRDLLLEDDLSVAAVVVERDGRQLTLPFDQAIRFDPRSRSAA